MIMMSIEYLEKCSKNGFVQSIAIFLKMTVKDVELILCNIGEAITKNDVLKNMMKLEIITNNIFNRTKKNLTAVIMSMVKRDKDWDFPFN